MSEGCPYFSRLLGPYLDGELPLSDVASVEAHIVACEGCREETLLLRAMRRSMRKCCPVVAPLSLRQRVASEWAEESKRTSRQEAIAQLRSRAGAVISFAAAAGFAIVWGVSHRDATGTGGLRAASISMGGVGDDVLGDLLDEHAQPLPPEATDPKEVRRLERYVGVPVQPSQMDHVGGRFVGGRVLPLHRNRAARLEYQMGSGEEARRVSVFIYDPRKVQISGGEFSAATQGSVVDNRVQVAHTRGYTVAVTQRGGVGYAVASDTYNEHDIVSVLP